MKIMNNKCGNENAELLVIINGIKNVKEKQFTMLKEDVNYIINNKIKDISKIERTLDYLLDTCYNEYSKSYYLKLCNYYEKIDKTASDFYRKSFEEFFNN